MQYDDGEESYEQLTDDEMKKLNSISISQKNDATFVRIMIEMLYKNNISDLLYRSFSGQKRKARNASTLDTFSQGEDSFESNESKAMSPAKKRAIFVQFNKRIKKIDMPEKERFDRSKTENIKRLVAVAIANHRAKLKANRMK